MKYSCNLIQDLLPLYHDDVCSEESKEIVKNHLSECLSCKDYYTSLCKADEIFVAPPNAALEMKKAASFCAVKKQLHKKQIFAVLFTLMVFAFVSFVMTIFLKHSQQVIPYEGNISVSMIDDALIGKLQGNQANYFKIKQVSTIEDGQENTYLFFYLSGTKWDDLLTNGNVFSEYVLCPADKGAKQIDNVFYYTGNYTGIENMNADELQKIIDSSILLWSK